MIQRVEALFYKGFKHIDVELRPFNILVGPNASGKSSLIDVFRLIQDILAEGPENGVRKRSASFDELIWKQARNYCEFVLEFRLPKNLNSRYAFARYEISLTQNDTEGITIANEHLWLIREDAGKSLKEPRKALQKTLFPIEPKSYEHILTLRRKTPPGWRKVISKSDKGNDYFRSENTDWNIIYRFGPKKASLARIPEDESRFPIAIWLKDVLTEGIQFIQLNSEAMKWPCRPDTPIYFESDGSNLPRVVQHLAQNHPTIFDRWVEHVKTALEDIKKINVKERPEDRFLYLAILYNNGSEIPSWLLSDGTLRLLAQTLIAYLPVRDKIYMIEEPENGLHPLAIETVIQSLSSMYENTVILATHSPVVLRLAEPGDILCFSKTASGAVDVVRGEDHPKLRNWKKGVDLATLHAAGVLQ